MPFHNVDNKSSQSTPLTPNINDVHYPAWKSKGNLVKWTVSVFKITVTHLKYENIFLEWKKIIMIHLKQNNVKFQLHFY